MLHRRMYPRIFRSVVATTAGYNNPARHAAAGSKSFSLSVHKSTSDNDITTETKPTSEEVIAFPTTTARSTAPTSNLLSPDNEMEYKPIILNSKEHAVGYLSRILNARVYEAAIETELQHAKNLSAVSLKRMGFV